MASEIEVVVQSPAPPVNVTVETSTPQVDVDVFTTGLPGRDGRDGIDGKDGTDGAFQAALDDHVNSPTPHPAYDEGPSFLLLYQNAKV